MRTWLFRRLGRSRGRQHRRPRARLTGCLLWIFVLFLLLIILSLLFGGFRKGTKAGGAGATARPPGTSAERHADPRRPVAAGMDAERLTRMRDNL